MIRRIFFVLFFVNFVISSATGCIAHAPSLLKTAGHIARASKVLKTTGHIVSAANLLQNERLFGSGSERDSEVSDNYIEVTVAENPNQFLCVHSRCRCCFDLDVPEISLKRSGCFEIGYLSEDIGLTISFTFDGKTLRNTSVSVKDPPPLYTMIPFQQNYGHICLEFHDVDFSSTHYAACAKIHVAIWPFCALPFELGCFHINGRNMTEQDKFARIENTTYVLEDSNDDRLWKNTGFCWKYPVCSSNTNYASSSYQVTIMNVLLFPLVFFIWKLQM